MFISIYALVDVVGFETPRGRLGIPSHILESYLYAPLPAVLLRYLSHRIRRGDLRILLFLLARLGVGVTQIIGDGHIASFRPCGLTH